MGGLERSVGQGHARRRIAVVAGAVLLAASSSVALAATRDFGERLELIDNAIRTNPGRVSTMALESCRERRNFAVRLHRAGYVHRAGRRLAYCEAVLGDIEPEAAEVAPPPTAEQLRTVARREVEAALDLEPDVERGLEIYRECAACHGPEGWGLANGSVPQIAGQHWEVVVKQLADMRAGNRDNVLMTVYASVEVIGGAQAVADVAGYIGTLEMSTDVDHGPGEDLERGAQLYAEQCVRCHGAAGEGDASRFVPRIQAQHFDYLARQFEAIRTGRRRNADPEMTQQIAGLDEGDARAVLDYVSRLEPPEELRAPPGWRNPDFVAPDDLAASDR